jgi:hypothetical protein
MICSNVVQKLDIVTLNNAITTEKKVMNAVANINGFEKTAGLLKTNV